MEWVDCKHLFSNGTEFELFMDKCEECTRYRNGKCRILSAIYRAMFDPSEFPFSDLQEQEGFGGKKCRAFTTEKPTKHIKQIKGQTSLFESEG